MGTSSHAAASAKRYKWYAVEHLVGVISDEAIAKLLGCHPSSARRHRVHRGIPPYRTRVGDDPRLGQLTDRALAKALGVHPSAVQRARTKAGIPAYRGPDNPRASKGVDWAAVTGLGVRSDAELADELGVTAQAVYMARRRRGISAPPKGRPRPRRRP